MLVSLLFLLLTVVLPQPLNAQSQRLRLVAANLTSGNYQSYDPGHGTRILQGLKPDIIMIQEFNYGDNSAATIQGWVTSTFGAGYTYYRESGAQIPNGVISRYPIVASGEWDDPEVTNRDFAWARIDIPGPVDLWTVSVHLLTANSSTRNAEAQSLVQYLNNASIPANAFLAIGGDFNTDTRTESCFTTLSGKVVTSGAYPVDKNNNGHTNASRSKPYDHVLVNTKLNAYQAAVAIGSQSFPGGLVFDTRVYTPLADVSPALATDSSASQMQHMAVAKDFLIPGDPTLTPSPTSTPSRTPSPTPSPSASVSPTPSATPSPSPSVSPTPTALPTSVGSQFSGFILR